MHCTLVTPETTLRDGPAEFVAVTLSDGELGVAPGHAPLIGRLGYGELRVKNEGATERYYVEGGFVEVLNDRVSVLAPRAVPAEKLDFDAAEAQLIAARERPANTPDTMAIRDRLVEQSRAQMRVAKHAET